MDFFSYIKSASSARDKLEYSNLYTLKTIKKSCEKEIDQLESQIPTLERETPIEIDRIHRVFDDEDYDGQRQHTQELRRELISALELKLKQSKKNLDKMKKLYKRVDLLIKRTESVRNKLLHKLSKTLGPDTTRSIFTFIKKDSHDKSDGNSSNHTQTTLGGKKMNKGCHTRKRKNKSFPKK
jgi:hypothetical protein